MSTAGLRVALFDDSADCQSMTRLLLEFEGYVVLDGTSVRRSAAALALLAFIEAMAPSVLVWDLGYPYRQHWETLQRGRESALVAAVPVVVTTTSRATLLAFVGRCPAWLSLLQKPFESAELLAAVRTAVQVIARPQESTP